MNPFVFINIAVIANVIQVKSVDGKQSGMGTTPDEIVSAMTFFAGVGLKKNQVQGYRSTGNWR
jgi:hypothetical protein